MRKHANLIKKVSFLCQTDKIVCSCRKYWLPPTKTWIFNVICHGLFCVQWFKMRGGFAAQIFSMSILWGVVVRGGCAVQIFSRSILWGVVVRGGCAAQIFSRSILWGVVVYFVDIDGIVDQHCLNSLFINMRGKKGCMILQIKILPIESRN
jgi:hypothetical protein